MYFYDYRNSEQECTIKFHMSTIVSVGMIHDQTQPDAILQRILRSALLKGPKD